MLGLDQKEFPWPCWGSPLRHVALFCCPFLGWESNPNLPGFAFRNGKATQCDFPNSSFNTNLKRVPSKKARTIELLKFPKKAARGWVCDMLIFPEPNKVTQNNTPKVFFAWSFLNRVSFLPASEKICYPSPRPFFCPRRKAPLIGGLWRRRKLACYLAFREAYGNSAGNFHGKAEALKLAEAPDPSIRRSGSDPG